MTPNAGPPPPPSRRGRCCAASPTATGQGRVRWRSASQALPRSWKASVATTPATPATTGVHRDEHPVGDGEEQGDNADSDQIAFLLVRCVRDGAYDGAVR